MRTQAVFVCAALVLACAYLPLGGAVTCEEDPNDANCIDCTVATTDPECVTTEAPTEAPTDAGEETTAAGEEPATTVPTDGTETTTAAAGGKKKIVRKRKFWVTVKPGKKTITRRRKGGKGSVFNKFGNSGGSSRSGRRGGRRSGRRGGRGTLGLF